MPGFRHGFRVNFIVFRGDWNCFISAIPSVILELTAQAINIGLLEKKITWANSGRRGAFKNTLRTAVYTAVYTRILARTYSQAGHDCSMACSCLCLILNLVY
jgi:hypothetical protein